MRLLLELGCFYILPQQSMMDKPKNGKNATKMEGKAMVRALKIEGMMCGHCEARVKKALETVSGVKQADVSHTIGTAIVTLETEVTDDVLKNMVVTQDYTVFDKQIKKQEETHREQDDRRTEAGCSGRV